MSMIYYEYIVFHNIKLNTINYTLLAYSLMAQLKALPLLSSLFVNAYYLLMDGEILLEDAYKILLIISYSRCWSDQTVHSR